MKFDSNTNSFDATILWPHSLIIDTLTMPEYLIIATLNHKSPGFIIPSISKALFLSSSTLSSHVHAHSLPTASNTSSNFSIGTSASPSTTSSNPGATNWQSKPDFLEPLRARFPRGWRMALYTSEMRGIETLSVILDPALVQIRLARM